MKQARAILWLGLSLFLTQCRLALPGHSEKAKLKSFGGGQKGLWSLRFGGPVPFSQARQACLGDGRYHFRLPSVADMDAELPRLLEGLKSFPKAEVWSSDRAEADPQQAGFAGQLIFDLKSQDLSPAFDKGDGGPKALTLCICGVDSAKEHCAKESGLPAQGIEIP